MTSTAPASKRSSVSIWRIALLLTALGLTLPGPAMPAHAALPIDFDTQIVPILTRQGCNAGACHGAAAGRGGFKLSLLGSNAALDHVAMVRELEGRRVNLHDAARSLVLRKPSGALDHEGGLALPEASDGFAVLRRWVEQGARRIRRRALVRLEVSPAQSVLMLNEAIELSAQAVFDDGSTEDVTAWTVFAADDPDAIEFEANSHRVIARRRGAHVVIARYLDRVLPIRLTVAFHDEAPVGKALPASNPIDDFVNARLAELRLPASPPADDGAFLRRVTLDLTGRLPTLEKIQAFTQDHQPHKRAELIQELLRSEAFADYWALKLANVFAIDSKQLGAEGAQAYHHWFRDRLRSDAPMTTLVTELVTATGDGHRDGPPNFLRTGSSPRELAEQVSRLFMGVRLQCANCHDHPLDHWTQDDYHGLAAIFAKLKRGRVVEVSTRGEVTHPVTGQPAQAKIPGGKFLPETVDGREALARWLTANETPHLAEVTVNRLWRHLMGRGLVDPVDDIRATNPASHPELLRWLADDFAGHGYRMKHSLATICNSAAYQRSSQPRPENVSDRVFYSHALSRPLEAEVIADAMGDVTGIPLELGEYRRAVRLTDNRLKQPSLDILGRCDRSQVCSQSAAAGSLAQTLHLINGPLVNTRVADPQGRLARLLSSDASDREVLEQLLLVTLGKQLQAEDPWAERILATIPDAGSESRTTFFQDLLWGLITSDSFLSNH